MIDTADMEPTTRISDDAATFEAASHFSINAMVALMNSPAPMSLFLAFKNCMSVQDESQVSRSTPVTVHRRSDMSKTDPNALTTLPCRLILQRCSDAMTRAVNEYRRRGDGVTLDDFVAAAGGHAYTRETINAMCHWHAILTGKQRLTSAIQWVEACRFQNLPVLEFLESSKNMDTKQIARLPRGMPLRSSSQELAMFSSSNWLTAQGMNRSIELIAMQCDNALGV